MTDIRTGSLRPDELEAIYAISRVVAETIDNEEALDQITKITRQVFIFDSAVIYLLQETSTHDLEPQFARAIGRGRSTPAELSWGEIAAKETIETSENYIFQAEPQEGADRLDQHFFLGLPMLVGGETKGAVVFIRFGGPTYTQDQINLAEFITTHISHLFERQRLVERIANLEAERRLAQLQENFISMVSHELNTPLGFIKGYTTTLLRGDAEWEEDTRREFLHIIDEETDRLSELIENWLDSSQLQAGTMSMNFSNFQLDQMLNAMINRLQARYPNLDIHTTLPEGEVMIRADSRRLGQVVDNLVSNAAKYAPRSVLKIDLKENSKHAVITIEDRGPGIPPEHLEHLFQRFYRVPERSGGVRGTGLGLFICDQIIQAHNGEIKVESELNRGTKFTIYLPLNNQELTEVKNE